MMVIEVEAHFTLVIVAVVYVWKLRVCVFM